MSHDRSHPTNSQKTLLNRIVVIGSTGSGKTTFASRISNRLNIPHIELDQIHWGPDWEMAPLESFRTRVSEALTGNTWVVDGNYSKVHDIVWGRADTIVWLDYPLRVCFIRLFRRTIRRVFTRERLWLGNREDFRSQFMSRDSLFWYLLKTHTRRAGIFEERLTDPNFAHLHFCRFRSPKETDRWVSSL